MSEIFIIVCIVMTVVGLLIRLFLPRILAWRGVWFCWHTRFGPAMVFDSEDADGTTVRLLNVRGTFQSVCYVDDELLWLPVCEYHRSWAQAVKEQWPRGSKRTRRALVLGGGGYSFPKWLVAYRPDFSCETVEIDPAITRIAREQFFLDRLIEEFHTKQTGRLTLAQGDAWEYLKNDTQGFDLIINDAFSGNKPLGQLEGRTGAKLVHEHLLPGGMYIGNVRMPLEGPRAKTLRETQQAFEQEFNHVRLIPERPEEPRKPGNNALIAWD
ncbi:MAG: fused MFS/spermidine synthase [Coriobacteriales bacterium]|nr:fused MFS/spermidine synthase [Coriobacteriales bacterium]